MTLVVTYMYVQHHYYQLCCCSFSGFGTGCVTCPRALVWCMENKISMVLLCHIHDQPCALTLMYEVITCELHVYKALSYSS